MNYVFVGGNFDKEGGRPSGLAAALNRGITSIWDKREGRVYNGGTLQELEAAAEMTRVPGIAVLWFANVPNDVPKTLVHSIKAQNQTCLLVTSKRVVEKKYDLMQVVQHALHLKSNLVLMFNRQGARYDAKLIDPLGNLFYASNDFTEMGRAIARRLDFLATVIRIRTERVEGTVPPVPAETGFFDYVRSAARQFSELLPAPKIVERFVGNAAFRCSFGFPAFREGELAFISRRNVRQGNARCRKLCAGEFDASGWGLPLLRRTQAFGGHAGSGPFIHNLSTHQIPDSWPRLCVRGQTY